jgi:hypothetical protein
MDRYQYLPLLAVHSEIRLLWLLPGSASDELSIEIFHATVSSKPVYEALSYVWGCPDSTRVVHMRKPVQDTNKRKGTSTLGVAENLFIAMHHLRYSSTPRVLWIDAICINQDDSAERSNEVLKMSSIYNNASQVIVWLGPSSHNSALALQTLERIGNSVTHSPERKTMREKPGSWPANLKHDTEALTSHADCWFAIKDLLTREWFSRLWVFQEIVLAQKASLVVGENCIDWLISILGLQWIWMMSRQLNVVKSLDIENIFTDAIWPFLERGCNPTAQSLPKMLDHTQKMLCSDPRDRLYAIRSLLYPDNGKVIVPDYSLSVEEVYSSFAKEWLLQLGNANFLPYCDLSQALTDIDLPSWVPNWSHTMATAFLSYARCSGMSNALSSLIDSNRRLSIQGVLVGSLSFVTPPAALTRLATEAEIRELCRSWMQLVLTGESVILKGGSNIDDSFIETIVAGRVAEKRPSTEKNSSSLDQIKAFLANMGGTNSQFVGINVRPDIRDAIRGRLLFKTAGGEGSFGVGPPTAIPGDRVAVILGCDFPLILRPDTLPGRNCFRVVGPCYISGIADSEVLLGPLPSGWSVREERVCGERRVTMFTNGDTRTQQDPRMLLPPAWRYRYGDWETCQEMEAEALEDMTPQWFENMETGEKTWADPRLTPQPLEERGVAVEELILI